MNISLIVDPYGEEKPGGLGRAVLQMAQGILETKTNEYTVYLKQPPKSSKIFERENARVEVLNVKRLWFTGGRKLRRGSDLCIFFTPIIPLLFFPKKSIAVVHDLAYLEIPPRSFKEKVISRILWCLHKISLTKATAVVAVSETAKESTIRHLGIPAEKIRVIYNGFIPLGSVPKEMEVPEKFFLFAGVIKTRKNVLGVVRAFIEFAPAHPHFSLLIAGKTGGAYAEEVQKLADDAGLGARVQFLGYVSDAELHYLYAKATALVFPSFIEGFGMPVLEAMEMGLPVITSNSGALAEVAGHAALLVDPHDPTDIARGMNMFARDEALREHYIELGRERASEFSWEKNARQFMQLIDSLS